MTQILDDCVDLKSDLGNSVWTLPLLYGLSQTMHPLNPQLSDLLYHQKEENPFWIKSVVDILVQMKAVSWSYQMIEVHRQQAIAAVKKLPYRQDLLLHYVTPQT